jgi:hypothetical protein
MKTAEEIKLKWQKHNRDNGMSWNEVAELVNEVSDFYRKKHDKSTLNRDKVMEVLKQFGVSRIIGNDDTYRKQITDAICSLSVPDAQQNTLNRDEEEIPKKRIVICPRCSLVFSPDIKRYENQGEEDRSDT